MCESIAPFRRRLVGFVAGACVPDARFCSAVDKRSGLSSGLACVSYVAFMLLDERRSSLTSLLFSASSLCIWSSVALFLFVHGGGFV